MNIEILKNAIHFRIEKNDINAQHFFTGEKLDRSEMDILVQGRPHSQNVSIIIQVFAVLLKVLKHGLVNLQIFFFNYHSPTPGD